MTKESEIKIELNIDGSGKGRDRLPIPFLGDMLTLFSKHGLFDLKLTAREPLKSIFIAWSKTPGWLWAKPLLKRWVKN